MTVWTLAGLLLAASARAAGPRLAVEPPALPTAAAAPMAPASPLAASAEVAPAASAGPAAGAELSAAAFARLPAAERERALDDMMDGSALNAALGFSEDPVIIGGCGRSGTTLLNSILSSHPRIAAVHEETYAFSPTAYSAAVDLSARFLPGKLVRTLAAQPEKPGAVRFSEKTPKNVLFFGRLLDYFDGKVKLIHLVRDGRDVVSSRHPSKPDAYYVSPERWLGDVAAGARFAADPRVLTLRYEDLIARSRPTLERLFAFLGEELHADVLAYPRKATLQTNRAWFEPAQPLHDASVGRWRRDPDAAERARLLLRDPRARPLLERFGYAD